MTTLKSFQHDIDEIHSREIAKQRGLHDKEKPAANATGKGKVKDEETGGTGLPSAERADLQEVEEDIIVCLSQALRLYCVYCTSMKALLRSEKVADHEIARDHIAALLTRRSGECLLRLGEQPARSELLSGELNDQASNWSGTPLSSEELDTVGFRIAKATEEIGGKVIHTYRHLALIDCNDLFSRHVFYSQSGTHTRERLSCYDYPRQMSLQPQK